MDYFEKNKMSINSIHEQGLVYYEGEGTKKDYKKALVWFLKGAELSYPESLYRIGFMYLNGLGVNEDIDESLIWFEKAALAGHEVAKHQVSLLRREESHKQSVLSLQSICPELLNEYFLYRLGMMFYFGEGVNQSYPKAIEIFKMGAGFKHPGILYRIGIMFYRGYGVEKNYNEAFFWLSKAADLGHAVAMYRIGIIYRDGLGISKNTEHMLDWYHLAAEEGNQAAIQNIAAAYQLGEGVKKNNQNAIEWYMKIKDYDENPEVLNNIAHLFKDQGEYEEARDYYKKAIKYGSERPIFIPEPSSNSELEEKINRWAKVISDKFKEVVNSKEKEIEEVSKKIEKMKNLKR